MPLYGGRLESEKRNREVYQIIRELGNGERRPVRFREITERLVPPPGSNDTTWRRVTAQRALSKLRDEGWIEKTVGGYRDANSPFYPLYGLRWGLDSEIHLNERLFDPTNAPKGRELAKFESEVADFTLRLAHFLGPWFRAIDDRLLDRAEELGSKSAGRMRDPVGRAASLAWAISVGYLAPEFEEILSMLGGFGKGWFERMTHDPKAWTQFLSGGGFPRGMAPRANARMTDAKWDRFHEAYPRAIATVQEIMLRFNQGGTFVGRTRRDGKDTPITFPKFVYTGTPESKRPGRTARN